MLSVGAGGRGGGLFGICSLVYHFFFSISLSLGDGLIQTEKLTQKAVKPQTINQSTLAFLLYLSILLAIHPSGMSFQDIC